ncbi:amidohydrolase [Thalassotalea euphylliae]|uniref:Amidohydrolase n=1 Tax=Thalassotalea euphylliae TaxID=1655234 RepID=A0A3E0TZF6_9GAMM|nr:amidohydrolase [Thalassotalea euphylliae]REL30028.1 amidohydrolase [Thalassotalea euphylliae]
MSLTSRFNLRRLFGLFLSSATLLALVTGVTSANAATTLIHNVKGYTINDGKLAEFSAIQFTDDKIDNVYATKPSGIDSSVKLIDGQGNTLLPGLIDAHGHVLNYGLSLMQVDLVNSTSEQEAVARVKAYREKNPEQRWVQGRGWNQVQWPVDQFPTAASLDKLFPNTPVFLGRVDGHAGWANSKAMALAGITKDTKAPVGGEIIKDSQGKPTGIFIDYAMNLITDKIPPLSNAEQKRVLVKAMKALAEVGLTSVHDAGVTAEHIELYQELAKDKQMPIRVNAMLYLPSPGWQQKLDDGQFASDDHFFQFNSVKIQSDGALGSRGAALHEDYSDQPGTKGILLHKDKDLANYIRTAMAKGYQVNTHAIGDHANTLTFDHYAKLIEQSGSQKMRHRIEHAQVLQLDDIPKFAKLNVIASIQATHATSDKNMAQDRIGKERLKGAYAWRSLLNAGARIANGSDFPVEPTNPFYGLHASITRQDRNNQPLGGWISEESLTTVESLKSFTIDAAYAGHQEGMLGSLEAGKQADFILIKEDLFTQEPSTIWQNKVLATWVAGKPVFTK